MGLAAPAQAQVSISGTVFEDVNYPGGVGRATGCAGCAARSGVRVELFTGAPLTRVAGACNAGTSATGCVTTNASGNYTFTGVAAGTVVVRVVNGSVTPSTRTGAILPVQTYRTDAASGTVSGVTNRVGGESPNLVDAGNAGGGTTLASLTTGTTTPQSITTILVGVANVTGIDFGFNADTVVSTRDAGQGSLRQYITNENNMTGATPVTSNFMIPDGLAHPGLRSGLANQLTGTAGVNQRAVITLASNLPTLNAGTVVDGRSQTTNVGDTNPGLLGTGGTVGVSAFALAQFDRPEVQVSDGGTERLITVTGSGAVLRGLALDRVAVSAGTSALVQDNLVGMRADGTQGTAIVTNFGITLQNTTGITVRHNYVKANNSGIRSDGLPANSGALIEYNEVARPASGHSATFDGMLIVNGAGGVTIQRNITRDQRGGGIEFGFTGTLSAQSNMLCTENNVINNGVLDDLTTPSTEPFGIVPYNVTGTNFVISRNVVTQNKGPGILVNGIPTTVASSGIRISQNSTFSNAGAANPSGPGIRLNTTNTDPNTLGANTALTPNDGTKSTALENLGMDYPIFTSAFVYGTGAARRLVVSGYVGSAAGQATFASSTVEVFVANDDGNQTGPDITPGGTNQAKGEGQTFVASFTTGASGSFTTTLVVPTGVTITAGSTRITGTATDTGNNTSEFGPNQLVAGADFGDAPNSYLTTLASLGPLHGDIRGNLRLGANLSVEDDAPGTLNGLTDPLDDAVVLPPIGTATTNYAFAVPVVNTTGQAGTLVAWVDFNRDGSFQPSEGASVAVPNGTIGNVIVAWSGLTIPTSGLTYARLRLSTDTNVGGGGTGLTTSTPGGFAANGEVEDYPLTIVTNAPTAALVYDVKSWPLKNGALVEWRTAAEVGTAGFLLERLDEARRSYQPVRSDALPSQRTTARGGVYRVLDPTAPRGAATYRIVEVEDTGQLVAYGPFKVDPQGNKDPFPGLPSDGADKGDYSSAPHPPNVTPNGPTDLPTKGKSVTRVKVSVDVTGLQRVDLSTLAASFGQAPGAGAAFARDGSLALTREGRSIPWTTTPDGSAMVFYGERADSPYTNANVYWIEIGKGQRMVEVSGGAPSPTTAADGFEDVIPYEKDVIELVTRPLDPEGDYWFWSWTNPGSSTTRVRSFDIAVPPLAATKPMASLSFRFQAGTTKGVADEHSLRFRVNGTQVGQLSWTGLEARTTTVTFDRSLLQGGATNRVEIEAVPVPGVGNDYVYIDGFDLEVRRTFAASASALRFGTEEHRVVTIGGFAESAIVVVDVTDPWQPLRLSKTTIDGAAGSFRVSFVPDRPELSYASASTAGYAIPRLEARSANALPQEQAGAPYVIITTPDLVTAAARLAAARQAQGVRAMVVTTDDVFDGYGNGQPTPHAIRSFLRATQTVWKRPAKWVLLAGAGSYDYKNILGFGDNLVPPLMVRTSSALLASDNAMADVFGDDGVPDVAIGRVPVRTAAELDAYVSKVVAFETPSPARGVSTLLADNYEAGLDFAQHSEFMATSLVGGAAARRIYLDTTPLAAARTELFSAWATKPSLVNWVGHGGFDRLAAEGLLTSADAPSLPQLATPIVAGLTCYINYFALPGYSPLGAELVLEPSRGAAAVWSATGLSTGVLAPELGRMFLGRYSSDPAVSRLGDAVTRSLSDYRASGGTKDMLNQYVLLGDPALRIPR